MSYAEFIQKLNVQVNFVSYYGVISAIPNDWKDMIKTSNEYDFEESENNIDCIMIY